MTFEIENEARTDHEALYKGLCARLFEIATALHEKDMDVLNLAGAYLATGLRILVPELGHQKAVGALSERECPLCSRSGPSQVDGSTSALCPKRSLITQRIQAARASRRASAKRGKQTNGEYCCGLTFGPLLLVGHSLLQAHPLG